MAPEDHLPKLYHEDVLQELLAHIGLPAATELDIPAVTANYHGIYRIKVPENERSAPHTDLILRVSGDHLPTIKTRNEVGVLAWVKANTTIPVPDVVAYDATTDNPLGREYVLQATLPGETLCDVYEDLSSEEMDGILDQMADFVSELHAHSWQQIGGLTLDEDDSDRVEKEPKEPKVPKVPKAPKVSRVVDETFWQAGDLDLFWPPGTTLDQLNVCGPWDSWTDMAAAYVRHYLTALLPLNASLRDIVDEGLRTRLEAFAKAVTDPERAPLLNAPDKTPLVLAHKDLHFANLLYDEESHRVTGVLDWEFAGVVPSPLWNPRRAFLWNGFDDDENGSAEKKRMVARFEERVRARNDPVLTRRLLDGQKFASPEQDAMQGVVDYLRAITEVAPHGGKAELLAKWKTLVEKNLAVLGV